jgi:Protein of unknown function (DUF3800)
MHLVYIDEAGISKASQEPFLVVAGVIVDGDGKLNGVKNRLERLMLRHIPLRHQDGFVFTAKHLFNGDGNVFRRTDDVFIGPREFSLERRLEIADDIIGIIGKFDLPVALGWVERATFPRTFEITADWPAKEITIAAHVSAFMNCAMLAEHWMRSRPQHENCLLVVENNDQAKTNIAEVQRYHQEKKMEQLIDETAGAHFPFRKIQEDPLFQPKRQSNPMILADFCAYVWKRFLMKDIKYNRFFEPLRTQIIAFDVNTLNDRAARRRVRNERRRV